MLVLLMVLVLVLLLVDGELVHEDDPRFDGAADREQQDVQARSGAGRADSELFIRTVWVIERQSGSLLYMQVGKREHILEGAHINMII